jgi:hypothetical protein
MKAGDIMTIPANAPHEFIYLEGADRSSTSRRSRR